MSEFMEDKNISPEDSLLIIQSMIDKAKNTVADNSFYFLLWGWIVFAACIGQFILKVVFQSPYHPIVWSICIIAVVFSILHGVKEGRRTRVRTYVDESLDYLWISITITYVLIGFAFARIGWQNCYTFYILLYAMGTYVTGRVLKFPPLVWGAIGAWLLAIASYFAPFDYNILICAVAILVSYIIPGHLLRRNYRNPL
jgi:hypothetical protein